MNLAHRQHLSDTSGGPSASGSPRRRWRRAIAVVGVAAFVAASCAGGGGDDEGSDGGSSGGAVSSAEGVRDASVQLVARGSFRDFDGSAIEFAGNGSGFIIDPSGLVVTNNHVVAGAGSVQAFVAGSTTPVNARILGVSECADLAVVQLSGEDFPYLEWYEGEVEPPLDVYAAGYPLGDPEFTLTRGVVSKARANGDWSWASVTNTIEHDANIQPGNSGGPLVTEDGQVVGVNYAGSSPTSTTQFFAIAADMARPIIDQLKAGTDVDTLGINGEAVVFEDGLTGIWVAGVTAGSSASNAGILPGDLILSVGGQTMGEDGTMRGYCDVLRTQGTDRAIAFEVYRIDTDQILSGEFNGRPIDEGSAPAVDDGTDEGASDGADEPTTTVGAPAGFYDVTDETGRIRISIPAEWSQLDGAPLAEGPQLRAAANLAAFDSETVNPGFAVTVFDGVGLSGIDPRQILDEAVQGEGFQCSQIQRLDYNDSVYTGAQYLLDNCVGIDYSIRFYLLGPPDGNYVFLGLLVYPRGREDIPIELVQTLFVNP